MSVLERLHPSVQYHVASSLGWKALRPVQELAAAAILDGDNCVVLAPTAGGKTEAAILPLLSLALSEGRPPVSILYVCPIRALLNNQEARLEALLGLVGRTVFKWHGDVADRPRKRMQRDPPDLLMTTPESLEVMLMSARVAKDALFGHVAAVVVDEVHAFAGDDRGAHLMAVLERVTVFCGRDLQRIGLSATVGDPEAILRWLQGSSRRPARIVNAAAGAPTGPAAADVALDYVANLENAARVIHGLHAGRKRLVFADSRAVVEELGTLLEGAGENVAIVHSSLGAADRQEAERRFAEWREGVIIATSALELGIDIGDLHHVLQIGAPSTVSAFLQRMGRTGRRPGTRPNCTFLGLERGRAFSLLQAAGLLRLWSQGFIEPLEPERRAYPVLAHQLLALAVQEAGVAISDWWAWIGGAACFSEISREDREAILRHMLEQRILATDGARLTLGEEGERRYGAKHFLELYAVFSAPAQLKVLAGNREIGSIDARIAHAREDRPLVVRLAGGTWRVTRVDWDQGCCHAEPTDEPGRAAWLGEGAMLSPWLARAMGSVLRDDANDRWWTPRAQRRIGELREERGHVRDGADDLHAGADGALEWWTFAGGRANALLAGALEERLGERFTAADLRIVIADEAARAPAAVRGAIRELAGELDAPTAERLAAGRARGRLSKFQACLPAELESRFLAARLFDGMTAREVARSFGSPSVAGRDS